MELQEIFDKVARHLLTQNEKAGHADPDAPGEFICEYRDAEGRKCAAGILIPYAAYRASLEGNGIQTPEVARAAGLVDKDEGYDLHSLPRTVDLARSLQLVHDTQPPKEWADALRDVAGKYGLNAAAVAELDKAD